MERTEEALRERVRETPLNERLKACEKYVASMCAERRPPKMTIPLQHYDEDFYIYTTLADAQATIAALQAQLNEQSEKLKYHDLFKQWQCWRDPDELVDEYEKWQAAIQEHQSLKDQLTQRTAELEAAKAIQAIDMKNNNAYREQVANLQAELEAVKQQLSAAQETILRTYTASAAMDLVGVKAELERVRGERDHAKKMEAVQKEVADNQTWHVQKLRTLILALPKVEGEIVAQAGYVKDRKKVYACFGSDADMTAYVALLKHRQGMEG